MHLSADIFAYLASFITIVLALAVSDIVQSLHRLLRAGAAVRWGVLPILAVVFVFLTVLSEFFSLWSYIDVSGVSFYALVGFMTVPVLIAMAACASLPEEVPPEGLDLRIFYFKNHRYLYSVLALSFLADFVRSLGLYWYLKAPSLSAMLPMVLVVVPILLPMLAILVVLARYSGKWVHLLGLITLLALAHLGYANWTIKPSSAAPPTSAHVPSDAH